MHYVDAKGILSATNGMNLYRGCTHGCIYCDSRSTCYQMNHDFEDIEVKANAMDLLEQTLKNKRKKCMIGTGSMCDPYMHIEEDLLHTRKCLELIERYGFGVAIQTKSARILRDLDILKRINEKTKVVVQMTLTTYDEDLCRKIEPNVSTTKERAEVLNIMRDNGIPTVVWMSPILPFINDTEENIKGILNYCMEAKVWGIICFGMGMTLREGSRDYFYKKLDEQFPRLKWEYQRVYGNEYEIASPNSAKLMRMASKFCKENGIVFDVEKCFAYMHQFEEKETFEQMTLF